MNINIAVNDIVSSSKGNKMFQTNIIGMQMAAEEIQEQIRVYKQCENSMKDISRNLSNMTGIEDAVNNLACIRKREFTSINNLLKMLMVLVNVINAYRQCENNIYEYAEGNNLYINYSISMHNGFVTVPLSSYIFEDITRQL